jgi:HEPN domain
MAPDDARIKDVHAWLSKAELDLRAAAHEISAPEEGLWGDVMFHAQQAAEKAMKAFLAWHDVPVRKIHNLEELGRQCVGLDATLGTLADRAAPLLNTRGGSAILASPMSRCVRRPNKRWRRPEMSMKQS